MALCGAILARLSLTNKEDRRILKKNCHGQEIFQNCDLKIICVKTVTELVDCCFILPEVIQKCFLLIQEITYCINKNIMGRTDKQTNLKILPWSPTYKRSVQIVSIVGFRSFKPSRQRLIQAEGFPPDESKLSLTKYNSGVNSFPFPNNNRNFSFWYWSVVSNGSSFWRGQLTESIEPKTKVSPEIVAILTYRFSRDCVKASATDKSECSTRD